MKRKEQSTGGRRRIQESGSKHAVSEELNEIGGNGCKRSGRCGRDESRGAIKCIMI